jgi:YhcH/YjgK/YiaL family protein
MICDTINNRKDYSGYGELMTKGLRWLADTQLDSLPEGRHVIDGEKLYAIVQQYVPIPPSDGIWESHRRYLDIQYLVSGAEVIGYCPIDRLTIAENYDEQKDVILYDRGIEAGSALKMEKGMFAVFFPQDAHIPKLSCQALSDPDSESASIQQPVRKIVLKVAVEE